MATRKDQTVRVPVSVRDEIMDCALRTQRSIAFLVANILRASPNASAVNGDAAELVLDRADDDPRDIFSRIKNATGSAKLDERIVGAWAATREKMLAWARQQERASRPDAAQQLDDAIREAGEAKTTSERLRKLAESEYPKVRALVGIHPNTPEDVVAKLADDYEKTVRTAVATRGVATQDAR